MKNECSVVRDLLPLYMEKMVSEETASFVKEHLENCGECEAAYRRLKEEGPPPEEARPDRDIAPLRRLRKKLAVKRAGTALLTLVFAAVVLLSVFAVLSAPEFFPYRAGLLSAAENADGSVTVTFDASVTNYRYYRVSDPEARAQRYDIEAWTCPWDRLFSHRGAQSFTIRPERSAAAVICYVQNNGEEDVPLWGQELSAYQGGSISLPRLAPGYYLILAAAVFCILLAALLLLRKQKRARAWLERALLLPVSYAVGHLIVLGFTTVSYSLGRDLLLILAISALVCCALLLAHSVWRLYREIREDKKAMAGDLGTA